MIVMSGDSSSCDTGSYCTSNLPTTVSPVTTVSLDGPGLDSSSSTSSIYQDICSVGGLNAAIDMYGIESVAKEIYAEHSSDPELIAGILKDTDMKGVDNLPYGVAGMIHSEVQYDPLTGQEIINSDIFYDNNLSPDDKLYTAIHELSHRKQLEYSKNMPRSLSEGTSEVEAQIIMDSYLNDLEDIYGGTLCTSYTSDPTYNECKALATDIYKTIGDSDIKEGIDIFNKALNQHGNDTYKALDSFETELAENGMNLKTLYNTLNDLDSEIEAKLDTMNPYADSNPATPYGDMIPPGLDGLGPTVLGIPYSDFGPMGVDYMGPVMQSDPFFNNKTPLDDLLHKPEDILEQYRRKTAYSGLQ